MSQCVSKQMLFEMRRLQLIDSYCSTQLYYRVCYVQMAASINATRSCGPCVTPAVSIALRCSLWRSLMLQRYCTANSGAQYMLNSQRIINGMASRVGWVKNRVRARYVTQQKTGSDQGGGNSSSEKMRLGDRYPLENFMRMQDS